MDQNGDQNQYKINIKDRVAKKMKKGGGRAVSFWMPFGDHFPLKIDEQINAKIDAEKVMKINEKSIFLERVNPRRPLYSCSKIGVGEGSPKMKEIKKRETTENNLPKNIINMSQKSD